MLHPNSINFDHSHRSTYMQNEWTANGVWVVVTLIPCFKHFFRTTSSLSRTLAKTLICIDRAKLATYNLQLWWSTNIISPFSLFFKFRGGVQKRSQKRIPFMNNFWWKIHFWLKELCWNWTELNITVKLDYSIWYGLAFSLLTSVWWFGSTSYWHESYLIDYFFWWSLCLHKFW